MLVYIRKHLRATLWAKDNSREQIGKCLKPLFFSYTLVGRSQANCKRLCKKVTDNLRIQIPVDNNIILLPLNRTVALIIRIIDKNRIFTIKLVHGVNVHTLNLGFKFSLQWMPHHEHIEQ